MFNVCLLNQFFKRCGDLVVGFIRFETRRPLTYVTRRVYFLLMMLICYSGHVSWNLGLGYTVEFVFVWAFLGWSRGVLIY